MDTTVQSEKCSLSNEFLYAVARYALEQPTRIAYRIDNWSFSYGEIWRLSSRIKYALERQKGIASPHQYTSEEYENLNVEPWLMRLEESDGVGCGVGAGRTGGAAFDAASGTAEQAQARECNQDAAEAPSNNKPANCGNDPASSANAASDGSNTRSPYIVYGHKSPLMIASFLACLRSGHAFVPVDSELPASRVLDIYQQIDNSHVIATLPLPEQITQQLGRKHIYNAHEMSVILADDVCNNENGNASESTADAANTANDDAAHANTNTNTNDTSSPQNVSPTCNNSLEALVRKEGAQWVQGEDTQYIIFTSGSTGKPKGIEVSARNVGNFMRWMHTFPAVSNTNAVFLDQAPYSFDLSEYQVVGALTTGGCLYAISSEVTHNYQQLFAALKSSHVNVWISTPSFADMCLVDPSFDHNLLPDVQLFLFCGETLRCKTARQLLDRFPNVRVANTYGPTESTVAVTYCEISRAQADANTPLPVGFAREGTTIYIVSHDTGKPVCAGEEGEIVIVGDTVAKGYYHNPEKTHAAFSACLPLDKHMRAYRTGDNGHLDEQGCLYFGGRIDNLVKVNGFRIELGDIERNLDELPLIAQSAVIPVVKDERIKSLRAYVVLDGSYSCENSFTTVKEIKRLLGEKIPPYMIPHSFKILNEMPLTANAKIDRKALKAL